MTGYQLKEGTFDRRPLTEDELWNGIWNYLGSGTMKQASYIFAFFNAILESLDEMDGQGRISYDRLFDSFSAAGSMRMSRTACCPRRSGRRLRMR